ncbi:MAG: hypothetical protein ACRERD_22670 [Candidatus Binatia bacterium]
MHETLLATELPLSRRLWHLELTRHCRRRFLTEYTRSGDTIRDSEDSLSQLQLVAATGVKDRLLTEHHQRTRRIRMTAAPA